MCIDRQLQQVQPGVLDAAESARPEGEFLAMLSHELRSPLACLANALEVIRHRDIAGAAIDGPLAIARRQVEHMTRLVDDLQDLARIARGTLELRKEPTQLATLVAHAVETCQPLLDSDQHKIRSPCRPSRCGCR